MHMYMYMYMYTSLARTCMVTTGSATIMDNARTLAAPITLQQVTCCSCKCGNVLHVHV